MIITLWILICCSKFSLFESYDPIWHSLNTIIDVRCLVYCYCFLLSHYVIYIYIYIYIYICNNWSTFYKNTTKSAKRYIINNVMNSYQFSYFFLFERYNALVHFYYVSIDISPTVPHTMLLTTKIDDFPKISESVKIA